MVDIDELYQNISSVFPAADLVVLAGIRSPGSTI